ncbi:MAG: hypothetical protein RBT68_00375 [Spirochaetia bacterium]|jgi:hypothetical protein|nr:hypothetical protein [Spirochaetia bacterium]
MIMSSDRRYSAWIVSLMLLTAALPVVQAQILPAEAREAGFTAIRDKRIRPYTLKSLSGTVISAKDLDEKPVLYHIWSPTNDPSGLGLAVAADLSTELPGAEILVLTTATTSRLSARVSQTTLGEQRAAASAQDAIRALGNPPAPAWVFVAAGGEIVALKLGRLDSGQAKQAIAALFQTWKTVPRPILPTGPAELPGVASTTQPAARPATMPRATPSVGLNTGLANADFAQPIEIDIVAELNLARTRPELYMEILNDYRAYIRGNRLEKPGETPILLEEGTKAVAIEPISSIPFSWW